MLSQKGYGICRFPPLHGHWDEPHPSSLVALSLDQPQPKARPVRGRERGCGPHSTLQAAAGSV